MNLAFSMSKGVVIVIFSSSPLIKVTSGSVGTLNFLYIDEDLLPDSYSYKFQEMKPELTDFFILIRVDPYHGPIIDVITTVQARKATEKQTSEAKTLHCSMVGRYCRGELKAMTLTEFVLGLVG